MRVQLALNVENLEESIEYYSKLFDTPVNKVKPGYANFSIDTPPLKLVLFEAPGAPERLNHLGVEAFEQSEVDEATERLTLAGLNESEEQEKTCCFATQNKVWSVDPNGARWEWYRVLEDTSAFGGGTAETDPSLAETETTCCAPSDR